MSKESQGSHDHAFSGFINDMLLMQAGTSQFVFINILGEKLIEAVRKTF